MTSNVKGSTTRGKSNRSNKIISITAPGDWAAAMRYGHQTVDITGQEYLSFWISSSQITSGEVSLHLRDLPTYSRPVDTHPVKLIAEGFIPAGKITPKEVRVLIPVSRLLEDSPDFQPVLTSALILQGTATEPVDLMLHGIQFLPAQNAPEEEDAQ
jgi:hypothetical protein